MCQLGMQADMCRDLRRSAPACRCNKYESKKRSYGPVRGSLCMSRPPMARALSDRLLQATFRMAKLRNSVCFARALLPEMTSDAVVPAHL